jgi:hypothetical protein
MTEKQLDELFPEITLNTNPRVRKKCLVVYLRKNGYRREEVAKLLRVYVSAIKALSNSAVFAIPTWRCCSISAIVISPAVLPAAQLATTEMAA